MPGGVRAFVLLVFATLALAFLAGTAVLVAEYWEAGGPPPTAVTTSCSSHTRHPCVGGLYTPASAPVTSTGLTSGTGAFAAVGFAVLIGLSLSLRRASTPSLPLHLGYRAVV
jgi:hypothetical protein